MFGRLFARRERARGGRSTRSSRLFRRKPLVELLEDRRMLAVLTVNSLADDVVPDDGLVTLREAIIAANTDGTTDLGETGSGADTIQFDPALFIDGPQTILLDLGDLEITESLTILGPGADLLSIDAQGNSRIFNISTTTGDFEIAGLTLTGGRTTADNVNLGDTTHRGGAIRSLTSGDLTITDSTIAGNSTEGAYSLGGGIFAGGGLTVTGSTISGNSTLGVEAGGGGISAIFLTLTDSTVSGNFTAGTGSIGGGISAFSSTIVDSTVSGNVTMASSAHGGGIRGFAVTLDNSTLSGNRTEGEITHGGGIAAVGAVEVSRSTIADNHAEHATAVGGGVLSVDGPVTMANSIVAGNTAAAGNPDLRPGTGALTVDFSLIGDTSGLTAPQLTALMAGMGNLLNEDPLLGPLANHGGRTQTHALLAGSPAIDTGDPSAMPGVDGVPEFDQRGAPFVRVADGDGDGTARIDMGAYERQTVPDLDLMLVVSTLDDVVDGDFSPGNLSLREAVGLANGSVGPNTITFSETLFAEGPATIQLVLGEIEITEELTILGPGAELLAIVGNSRIFNITAPVGDFEIAGLTLTGGSTTGDNADAMDTTHSGGAIRSLTSGDLTISDSVVTGNFTTGQYAAGGGIFAVGNVTLAGSAVSGNYTAGHYAYGGGISSRGDVTLTGSNVDENLTSGDFAFGGGIDAVNVSLAESTVSGNRTLGAAASGGGISALGEVTLTRSTVSGNYTTGDDADGGGIYAQQVTITESTISGNRTEGEAASGGGLHLYSNDASSIYGSTISGNSATGDGGGIFSNTTLEAALTITNSTISGNTAGGVGGGIFNFDGRTIIEFSTITNNTAPDGAGSGVASYGDDFTLTQVRSTIIAGNTNSDVDFVVEEDVIAINSFESLGYNLIGTGNALAAFVNNDQTGVTNPGLAPLADNGGPTLTHALLPDSPALDAGNPAAVAGVGGVPLFDQRGESFPRVLDGTGDGIPRIDIGAFEAPRVIPVEPRLGIWSGGRLTIDANRNFVLDPPGPGGDLSLLIGFSSDYAFAGNFVSGAPDSVDGFDKMAAYGRVGGEWRWLIDFNGDGIIQANEILPAAPINGIPVAGNFGGAGLVGHQAGVFTGSAWHFDTTGDFQANLVVPTNYTGYPIVGDFNNNGLLDVMTYVPSQNVFYVDLGSPHPEGRINIDGVADFTFRVGLGGAGLWGFPGVRERPVAADINGDGIIDIGMWVPDTAYPGDQAEWFFLLSGGGMSVLDRLETDAAGNQYVAFRPFADLHAQFGGRYGIPVVGNFDVPTPIAMASTAAVATGGSPVAMSVAATLAPIAPMTSKTGAMAAARSPVAANATGDEASDTATATTTAGKANTAPAPVVSRNVATSSFAEVLPAIATTAAGPAPSIASTVPTPVESTSTAAGPVADKVSAPRRADKGTDKVPGTGETAVVAAVLPAVDAAISPKVAGAARSSRTASPAETPVPDAVADAAPVALPIEPARIEETPVVAEVAVAAPVALSNHEADQPQDDVAADVAEDVHVIDLASPVAEAPPADAMPTISDTASVVGTAVDLPADERPTGDDFLTPEDIVSSLVFCVGFAVEAESAAAAVAVGELPLAAPLSAAAADSAIAQLNLATPRKSPSAGAKLAALGATNERTATKTVACDLALELAWAEIAGSAD